VIRWLKWLLGIPAILYLGVVVALWSVQDRLIFPGWVGPSVAQVAAVPDLTEITIPGDPDLRGWYRPAAPGRPTLVVFHGNAGFQWPKLTAFAARGYGILFATYRGFAGNPGAPSETGLMADGRATLARAAALDLRPEDVVIYGESLGSGVAARMALEPGDWRALVLDAPYTSVRERAAEMYPYLPVRPLVRHAFDTLSIIEEVEAPLLILHGTADFVIPVEHGRTLLAAATEPKAAVWFEGGSHLLPAEPVAEAVDAFLRGLE
jgi:pimeloyl-ACP methyl ester carboxylesterase